MVSTASMTQPPHTQTLATHAPKPPATGEMLLWAPAVFAAAWMLWDLAYWWRKVEDYNFGWLVPVLSGYFIYDQWDKVRVRGTPDTRFYWWAWVAAAPIFALVELNRQLVSPAASGSWLLSLATLAGIAATILATRGWDCLRLCRFPLLFLLVAVPLPGTIWKAISTSLQMFVAAANVEILQLLGIAAIRQGNVIQLNTCQVGIDEACSGIRSLQSSIMVSLLMGKLLLTRIDFRILIVLLAPVIAIPGNVIRTLILSLTAQFQGIDAMRKLHDAAGWSVLAFTVTVLALIVLKLRAAEDQGAPPPPKSGNASAPAQAAATG